VDSREEAALISRSTRQNKKGGERLKNLINRLF
jgi:hypothetical protein